MLYDVVVFQTLEINWHDGQAVYSVDFSPDGLRFATAGADASVRLWSIQRQVSTETTMKATQSPDSSHHDSTHQLPVSIDFLSELKRHSCPVNVVRFSPNGDYIASAGDDACIILWKLSTTKETTFGSEYSEYEKETWTPAQMLYGHNKEIYDLAWSPCGNYFITASIDNTARVWSITDRAAIHVFTDHTHYVQGVAWDPLGQFVATQSSDRSLAIYKCRKGPNGRLLFGNCAKRHNHFDRMKADKDRATNTTTSTATTVATVTTMTNVATSTPMPSSSSSSLSEEQSHGSYRLFHDENLVSFFRRLSFSPDGGLLIAPAGLYKNSSSDTLSTMINADDDMQHCSYIFPRNTVLKYPIACTGNHSKPSIAIRWCQQAYERRPSKHSSLFNLPYRIVYAVATQDSVYIYDTQQDKPICAISGMHYAPITDLSWSSDGTILTFSSADGYCSAAVFSKNELGVPIATKNVFNNHVQDEEMTEASNDNNNNNNIYTPTTTCNTLAISDKLPTSTTVASTGMTTLDQWTTTTKSVSAITKDDNLVKNTAGTSTTSNGKPTPTKKRITPILVSASRPSTTQPLQSQASISGNNEPQSKKRRITPIPIN
ncbi:WD40-repeat-containing domain protein [Halteromyces radiatus]|uniref:WD40-repeat-containing domain protein n=1 Tax=Halteromyces radiatus TaxID=101107 RepID=UPI00221E5F86|nr:WD40-repeat-containing domain protein [Halteromyces radiatus]KAI8097101.1 WD40-repeat-containing domain protein [Halteromyces radiatus]